MNNLAGVSNLDMNRPNRTVSALEHEPSIDEAISNITTIGEKIADIVNGWNNEVAATLKPNVSNYLIETIVPLFAEATHTILSQCGQYYCPLDSTVTGSKKFKQKTPIYWASELSDIPIFDKHSVKQLVKDVPNLFHTMGQPGYWQKMHDFYPENALCTKFLLELLDTYEYDATEKMLKTCWDADLNDLEFSCAIKIYESIVLQSDLLSEDDWSIENHEIVIDFGADMESRCFGDAGFPSEKINFQRWKGFCRMGSIFPYGFEQAEHALFVNLMMVEDPDNSNKRILAEKLSKLLLSDEELREVIYAMTIENSRLRIYFNH